MACKIEPKLGQDGQPAKWDPKQIPSTKPFVRIVTSAYEPVTTIDNMRFVKTRSLIYTPFHKEARYVNFEIGYPKEAKWLEFVTEKWADYANFFVAGFFEAIYTASENGTTTTYAQIDAKNIDYDIRFRHPNSPENVPVQSPSNNAFAQRRNRISPENSPTSQRSVILRNNSITMEDSQEEANDNDLNDQTTKLNQNLIVNNNKPKDQSDEFNKFMNYYRMFKSQESQESQESQGPQGPQDPQNPQDPQESQDPQEPQQSQEQRSPYKLLLPPTSTNVTPKKRQLSDLCHIIDDPDEPVSEPKQKRTYNRKGRGRGRGRAKK